MEKAAYYDIYGPPFVEQISRSTMDWYHQLAVRQLREVFTDLRCANYPEASNASPTLVDVGSNIHPSIASASSRVAFEYAFPNGRYVGIDLERAAFTSEYLNNFRNAEHERLRQKSAHLADRWLATYQPRSQEDIAGHAMVGSAEALPLASESVDIILFSDVLEHIVDYHRALEESSRSLRPGGRLCLVIPQTYNLNVVQALPHVDLLIDAAHFTTTHINFWTPSSLSADLQKHNLAIVDSRPVGLLMGANWLLQLDENYAWGQRQHDAFMSFNSLVADLFAWDQIDANPAIDSCPGLQHIDTYFYANPTRLQDLIRAAQDPVDLLAKMLNVASAIYPYADSSRLQHAKQVLQLLAQDYDTPLAAGKFKSLKPLLDNSPLSLANDVIFVTTRMPPS